MPFDPDDLVKKEYRCFKVEVKGCALCPFSEEHLDQTGDYVGNSCSVTEIRRKMPDCFDIPEHCPLKDGKCIIEVELKK